MSIIRASWFPTNLIERAAWFQNFAAQFSAVAVSLGFTAAQVTQVNNDSSVMQFFANLKNELQSIEDAVRAYRKIITEGDTGDVTPAFPAWTLPLPPVLVDTGLFERLERLVDKIKLADNYTEEIGALLGIIPTASGQTPPEQLKATIKAEPVAAGGYKFNAFVGKQGMDGFKVQIRRMDSETWTDAAFGTSSPLEVAVTPNAPNQPEQIQARSILLRKNQPVGQPSDAVYVTVTP